MNDRSRRLLVWRLLLGLFGVVVIWRIAVLGLAEHYVEDADEEHPRFVEKALAWDGSNPRALYLKSRSLMESDPRAAIELARRSLRADPADARPLVVAAYAWLGLGETERADAAMDAALKLMPAMVSVRLAAVDYWVKRNELEKALESMGLALHAEPALGKEMFPILLKLLETPETRWGLQPFVRAPPVWWDRFFAYAMERAVSLETVTMLYAMRSDSPVPMSKAERREAVGRLMRDKEWAAAYLAWVNSLEKGERAYLGSVYNGGFELAVSNEGFDWHVPRFKGVNGSRQRTYGVRGENALRMIFSGREFAFHHLYQYLFLAPGDYRFLARVRPDRLQGRGGLQWVVRCADDPVQVLGESERLIGASEWRGIDFGFSVPPGGCTAQILRLESTGRTLYDHKLEGEIWFDEVLIRLVRDT